MYMPATSCTAQTRMAKVSGSMTCGRGSELPRMMPSKKEWMSQAATRVSSAHFSKSQISQTWLGLGFGFGFGFGLGLGLGLG